MRISATLQSEFDSHLKDSAIRITGDFGTSKTGAPVSLNSVHFAPATDAEVRENHPFSYKIGSNLPIMINPAKKNLDPISEAPV